MAWIEGCWNDQAGGAWLGYEDNTAIAFGCQRAAEGCCEILSLSRTAGLRRRALQEAKGIHVHEDRGLRDFSCVAIGESAAEEFS